jgi:hypothetical protein
MNDNSSKNNTQNDSLVTQRERNENPLTVDNEITNDDVIVTDNTTESVSALKYPGNVFYPIFCPDDLICIGILIVIGTALAFVANEITKNLTAILITGFVPISIFALIKIAKAILFVYYRFSQQNVKSTEKPPNQISHESEIEMEKR